MNTDARSDVEHEGAVGLSVGNKRLSDIETAEQFIKAEDGIGEFDLLGKVRLQIAPNVINVALHRELVGYERVHLGESPTSEGAIDMIGPSHVTAKTR